jgi:hypothetical protein
MQLVSTLCFLLIARIHARDVGDPTGLSLRGSESVNIGPTEGNQGEGERRGLADADQSEPAFDTSKGLADATADVAHRILFTPIAGDLSGDTPLPPGVYESAAAISLSTTLYLNAQAYPDVATVKLYTDSNPTSPLWKFKSAGAFVTAAASMMVFVDTAGDALDSNTARYKALEKLVVWDVTGAITLGAESTTIGDMNAAGAIAVGAGATCGNMVSDAAVVLGADVVYLSVFSTTNAAVTLGTGTYSRWKGKFGSSGAELRNAVVKYLGDKDAWAESNCDVTYATYLHGKPCGAHYGYAKLLT